MGVFLTYGLRRLQRKHLNVTKIHTGLVSSVCTKKILNITLISLNRPDKINAINLKTLDALQENIKRFEDDTESPLAILYGQEGNFCSGFDLHELDENPDTKLFDDFREFLQKPAKKPIIAAITGYAVGQGLDLALWCDLRFVEENVLMGFYNRRFAIPTCDVTIRRLGQMIGTSRTMDMISLGRHITAREALDWGLCNKMVNCGTAVGEAMTRAIQMSKLSQSMLADRATVLSECETCREEWMSERKHYIGISFEKSKTLIRQFIRGEYGHHGSFKNSHITDSLDFLKN
ncbi:hypothetical protein M8J77_023344 [Diaphorina citri]|nr:hypothetical protein M8J77_023344 [Diaphorina citri]